MIGYAPPVLGVNLGFADAGSSSTSSSGSFAVAFRTSNLPVTISAIRRSRYSRISSISRWVLPIAASMSAVALSGIRRWPPARQGAHIPMRRYAAAPLDNGRFDLNNEVKTASDASMNDDLPLLLEQTNEFLFDIDIASDCAVPCHQDSRQQRPVRRGVVTEWDNLIRILAVFSSILSSASCLSGSHQTCVSPATAEDGADSRTSQIRRHGVSVPSPRMERYRS